MPDEETPARKIVESEIRSNGPITFARFMEIALYGEHGYYSNSPRPGSDYATSPQMHPAFGALIAGWLLKAWEALGWPERFDVVEIGAGNGGLARDVLDAVSGTVSRDVRDGALDGFRNALNYRPFDIRPRNAPCQETNVERIDDEISLEPIVGCVISNELLDALPCHVFTIRKGAVRESFVALDCNGDLTFVDGEVSELEIEDRVRPFASSLPDGYRGEVNLGIEKWASNVATVLERGYVLTIDYGYKREMLYHPSRAEGSLRCYRDHVLGQNPFRDIGLQDITAHVDFTAVGEAFGKLGFDATAPLLSQRDFLFDLGIGEYNRQIRRQLAQPRGTGESYQLMKELRSLNALVDPRGLGGFNAAQQGIDAAPIELKDLESSPAFVRPSLSPRHLRQLPYD